MVVQWRISDLTRWILGHFHTWEQWQWRGALNSPKFHNHLNLIIRLFSVISKTLVVGWGESYLSTEVQSVYFTAPANWAKIIGIQNNISCIIVYKLLLLLDRNTLNHTTVCKWFISYRNTWYHISVCRQRIKDNYSTIKDKCNRTLNI